MIVKGCFKELNKIVVVKKIMVIIINSNVYCLLFFLFYD